MKSSRFPALVQSRDTHRACQLASAAVAGPNRPGPFRLSFGWEGFVEEVRNNRPPAALVEVLSFSGDGAPNPELRQLLKLTEQPETMGLLFYVDPRVTHRDVLDLGEPGASVLVVKGVDDDPASLLRALARAVALPRVRRALRTTDQGEEPGDEGLLLLQCLCGWPPCGSAQELAKNLNVSTRTLRRRMQGAGLPCPRALVGWSHLLEAVALAQMGVADPRQISLLTGLEEPSSLYRLSRKLCGTSLPDLLKEAGIPDVVELLLADIEA